jgi:hypothetical protein
MGRLFTGCELGSSEAASGGFFLLFLFALAFFWVGQGQGCAALPAVAETRIAGQLLLRGGAAGGSPLMYAQKKVLWMKMRRAGSKVDIMA